MSRNLMRLGAAAFVLLLSLIVSLPARGQAQPAGSIEVESQKVVDGAIVIRLASISQDGWVVVRKAGPDGKPVVAPEIGTARIRAGESRDVVVQLSEPVADGATIWAMLHIDKGDIGVYEFPGGPDTPVVAAGAPVMAELTVTGTESTPVAQVPPPDALPVTAGEDLPVGLLAVALALIVGGAVLARAGAAEPGLIAA